MTNFKTALRTSEPVAFGGFSSLFIIDGRAVKLLEDACRTDVLEEAWKQNLAAEAGLAPRVHAVADIDGEVAVVMDAIDTDRFWHPDDGSEHVPCLMGEMPHDEMVASAQLFARLIQAGILHCDFHAGNIFLSDEGEAQAIDFGISEEIGRASLHQLRRCAIFLLPVLERLDLLSEVNQLRNAASADELRALLPQVGDSLLAL